MKFKLTWRLRGRVEASLVFNTKEEATAAQMLFHTLFPTPDRYDYVQLTEEESLNGHVFTYTELRVFEELLKAGNKVLAIRFCRDIAKSGLKESKDFIDGLNERMPKQPAPAQLSMQSVLDQIKKQHEAERDNFPRQNDRLPRYFVMPMMEEEAPRIE